MTSSFENKLEEYIQEHQLCTKVDALLIGVSGGIDSMVLLDSLNRLNYQVSVAHCNFQMREGDSTGDEDFVRRKALHYSNKYYTTAFDTKEYAKENKMGIQEAARVLRYTWFSKIMEQEDFRWLVVAHHQDDQIETILLNMVRGAGIFGLQGMQPKRHHIIRPMLFASKEDIINYSEIHEIEYREDSSNAQSIYRRNYFRNKLIPQIEEKVPSFKKRMSENILIWQKSARLLKGLLTEQLELRKKNEGEDIILDIDKIEESLRDLVVYEWLRPYGFNYTQVNQIIHAFDEGHSGRLFYSVNNRIITDRKRIILSSKSPEEQHEILIQKDDRSIGLDNGQLDITLLNHMPENIIDNKNVAYLDAAKLVFPLVIRKWRHGDSFQPFGMQGKSQKLKKFFSTLKFSHFEKERQHLIVSNDMICWVVGRRLDNRFRVDAQTKYILKIIWSSN
jgi:tRNA(Ile)-lysidine synthase